MIAKPYPIALVLQGEGKWGPYQMAFSIELTTRLQEAGFGEYPYSFVIGTSSGSVVATQAASASLLDHDFMLEKCREFAAATNHSFRIPPPFRKIFEKQLQEFTPGLKRAVGSPTTLALVSSNVNRNQVAHARNAGANLIRYGLQRLINIDPQTSDAQLARYSAELMEAGSKIFEPRYFATKEWPEARKEHCPEHWRLISNEDELFAGIRKSTRLPIVMGKPIYDGSDILIDGIFANNAAVKEALDYGAKDVIVVTSSSSGHIHPKPLSTIATRLAKKGLTVTETIADRVKIIPGLRQHSELIRRVGDLKDDLPPPDPIDLKLLRERYPKQRLHVRHPPKASPQAVRLGELRPDVLENIYELGRKNAEEFAKILIGLYQGETVD